MKGWWHSATTEQKLAQVRAGIELGMTSAQVAMNCGCVYYSAHSNDRGTVVNQFARRHGLHFTYKFTENTRQGMIAAHGQKGLYGDWSGAPRDLVSGLEEWGWQ